MADIKPSPLASGAPATPKTAVTTDQALASLIESNLLGGGDGGSAAVQWYNDRKPKKVG